MYKRQVVEVTNQIGSIDRVTHAGAVMPMGSIKDLDSSSINNLMRINYEGTVNIVSNVLPSMLEKNSGQIILFGSIAGTCPLENMSAYCASKAAVNIFGEILAKEVKDYDPLIALSPGEDALDPYREISSNAMRHLTPDGRLLLEIGHTQGIAVSNLLEQAGYKNIAVHLDLEKRDRIVSCSAPA